MIRSLGLPGLGGRGFGAGKVQHKVSEISLSQFCMIIPTSGGGADSCFCIGVPLFILFEFWELGFGMGVLTCPVWGWRGWKGEGLVQGV